MKTRHRKTLVLLFHRPVSGNVRWEDAIALLREIGAEFEERTGSRVAITLNSDTLVQHKPHPSPNMDKGAVASLRKFLEFHGVKP